MKRYAQFEQGEWPLAVSVARIRAERSQRRHRVSKWGDGWKVEAL